MLLQQLQPARERLFQETHSGGRHVSQSLNHSLRGSWHLPPVPRPPSGVSSDRVYHNRDEFPTASYIHLGKCTVSSVILSPDLYPPRYLWANHQTFCSVQMQVELLYKQKTGFWDTVPSVVPGNPPIFKDNHRIIRFEGTFKGHPTQLPCNEPGQLQLDQGVQSLVQPWQECLHKWGIHQNPWISSPAQNTSEYNNKIPHKQDCCPLRLGMVLKLIFC